MSLLGFSPTAHAQTYPYFCGFEDDAENAQWTLVNGNCANQWYIGTAAKHEGEKGLYITNDGGATTGYDTYSNSTVYAYRTFESPKRVLTRSLSTAMCRVRLMLGLVVPQIMHTPI